MPELFKPMFIPPVDAPAVVALANTLLPVLGQTLYNVRDIHVGPEAKERLETIRAGRALLCPNHPTEEDPIVMYWLSRNMGMRFNYLAARDAMDGPRGWWMNRLGAYSVIRGGVDREALRATRKLLAELDRKVVIFPEGAVYEHNDALMVFQSGVAQIGFWSVEDLHKAGKKAELPLLPVAIKYRLTDSPRPTIESSLRALEEALGLHAAPKLGQYQRLLRLGDRLLCSMEGYESVKRVEGADLPTRVRAVRQAVTSRVARAIGTEVRTAEPPADQLHHLFNELRAWVGRPPDDASPYEERLYRKKLQVSAPLFEDLQRLANFIMFTGDYVAAEATAERFLEVLGRLEKEVLGEVRHRVPREALVRIAPPIRMEERYDAYRENKRQAVADVTREVEGSIRSMLQELSREATPISLEA